MILRPGWNRYEKAPRGAGPVHRGRNRVRGSAGRGVGFVLPVLLNFVKSTASFYLAGLCSVVGMLCLRHFILYAGQIFGL